MSPRTTPRHPPGDRLGQLLRSAGEGDTGEAHPVEAGPAEADPEQPDRDEDWVDAAWPDGTPQPGERVVRGRHRVAAVPLVSVPESLRSAELGVGVRAVRGLLVLVVAVTLVLGGRWLWTQRVAVASPTDRVVTSHSTANQAAVDAADGGAGERKDRAQEEDAASQGAAANEGAAAGDGGAAGGAPGEEGAAESSTSPAAQPAGLVVHVTGQVLEPGVVTLPAGSRVVDAVRAAGGLTDEADQSTLNLARLLVDGERVWVGRPGETAPEVAAGPVPPTGAGSAGTGGAGGVAGSAEAVTPLELNAATQADLEELPGIGPVTAGHILAWREEHGRFSSVDELLEVSGIGERTLAQLRPLVTVGG